MGDKVCTCVGFCKGKEGLGEGWACALEEADRTDAALVEALPTVLDASPPSPPPDSAAEEKPLATWVDDLLIDAHRAARKMRASYMRHEVEARYEFDALIEGFAELDHAKRREVHRALSAHPVDPAIEKMQDAWAEAIRERDQAREAAGAAQAVGAWMWTGNGEDELSSMSDGMAITMTAGALKQMLAHADPAIAAWREVPDEDRMVVVGDLRDAAAMHRATEDPFSISVADRMDAAADALEALGKERP